MRTKEQYFDGLNKMKKNVYFRGKLVGRNIDEMNQGKSLMAVTFDAAADPETRNLCTAKSHITGETINRFCHVHQSTEDLHKKQDMTRALTRKVGFCVSRCMGIDGINAVNVVSYEADRANGGKTKYYENFLKWLENFQKNDLVGACAQTDVKGERLKRPCEQTDPDAYLHVTEKKNDGIVVRGCKVHITQASLADEIIVIPTRALGSKEKDYAVAFAVPGDYKGVKHVINPHGMRKRDHFKRGFDTGAVDSYVIFDDVFVPWERVFLCGEHMMGGMCALLFALFHRHSYSGCKPAFGDMLIGLVSLAAEVNGIDKTPHFREKLADLIKVAELGYAAGFTASDLGKPEVYIPGMGQVPFGPGSYIPNSIYANVGRCLTGESMFHESEILCDIAGGMPATFPMEDDLVNEETRPLLEKYINRNHAIPIEEQIRMWLYYVDVSCSTHAAFFHFGGYHGGGSPTMEQIAITSQYDIELRKELVRKLAGMKPAKK